MRGRSQPTVLTGSAIAGMVGLAAGLLIVATGTDGHPILVIELFAVLVQEGWLAVAWLLTAAGLGYPLRRWLLPRTQQPVLAQVALGCGALILIDWAMGWGGWLTLSGAWVVGAIGIILLLLQIRLTHDRDMSHLLPVRLPWSLVATSPALGLMLGAATVCPGVLWASEFGGYDVLEYHLQLPREWLAIGHITGLSHNVYSYLPNAFEAAYMHLGAWRGSMVIGSYGAQLLHASMALIGAAALANLARFAVNSIRKSEAGATANTEASASSISAPAIAAGLLLATPWIVVTGSLAYNEQAMLALALCAAAIGLEPSTPQPRTGSDEEQTTADPIHPPFVPSPWRTGLAAGLLLGAAILCKLTAAVVALPALALLILLGSAGAWRGRILRLVVMLVFATLIVGIWAVRNFTWTGNPLFPMFTGWFGTAHWTADQAARWQAAHSAPSLDQWPLRLWQHIMAHWQYAWIIWPGALVSLVVLLRDRTSRSIATLLGGVLLIQLLAWLLATHQQSRFAIPLLPVAVVLIALGLWRAAHLQRSGAQRTVTIPRLLGVTFVAVVMIFSIFTYLQPAHRAAPHLINGHVDYAQNLDPYRVLNTLPEGSQTYAEGFATPFYVRTPIYYHTVWDRSPLGAALASAGPGGALAAMLQEGYTHLLIDLRSLGRWWSPGNYGYDPTITLESLQQLDRLHLTHVLVDKNSGIVLYTLPRPRANP
jgi:hypothetical protein